LLDPKDPSDEKVIASRGFHDDSPVIANSDGNPEIYLLNSDGSGVFRLTHTKAAEMTPQFSKDGHSLFHAANRNQRFDI